MMRAVWRVAICVGLVGCRPVPVQAPVIAAPVRAEDGDVPAPVIAAAVRAGDGDVQALVAAFATASRMTPVSRERQAAGAYTLHVAHLEQGPVADDEVGRFSDAQYVVVEHGGALAELGVLSFVDETVTHFKHGADFSLVGVHASPLGPLLLLRLATWWRADPERTTSVHGTATHARDSLLVCRWTDTLVCAAVPLFASETAVVAEDAGGAWAVRVEYEFLKNEAGQFVFTLREGDAAEADALGLPRGGIGVAELFKKYPAGSVGQTP